MPQNDSSTIGMEMAAGERGKENEREMTKKTTAAQNKI